MAESSDYSYLMLECNDALDTTQHLRSLQDDFPWLQHQQDPDILFCKPCVDSGLDSFFAMHTGRNILKEHGTCHQHMAVVGIGALGIYSGGDTSDLSAYNQLQASHAEGDNSWSQQQDPVHHHHNDQNISSDTNLTEDNADPPHDISMEQLDNVDDLPNNNSTDGDNLCSATEDTLANSSNPHEATNGCLETSAEHSDQASDQVVTEKVQRKRKFLNKWFKSYSWLKYDKEKNRMFCKVCLKHSRNPNNSFIKGNHTFKNECLTAHAGSIDHQLAEKHHFVESGSMTPMEGAKNEITAKQKFILRKFLHMYPWLEYRADVQMLACELCRKYTVNTLFVDVRSEIDHEVIQQHSWNQFHIAASAAEVKSWSTIWDVMTSRNMSTECLQRDQNPSLDVRRRSAALFSNASVTVTGTDNEIMLCNGEINPSDVSTISERTPEKSKCGNVSETSMSHTPKSAPNHLQKKPFILPVFGAFQIKWLREFPWLHYEKSGNVMICKLCQKHKKKIAFARGVRCFSRSYIVSHSKMKKHRDAASAESSKTLQSAEAEITSKDQCATGVNKQMDNSASVNNGAESSLLEAIISDLPLVETEKDSSQLAVEDCGANDSSETSPHEKKRKTGSSKDKRIRCFYPNWQIQFPWVCYQKDAHAMVCMWCIKHNQHSSFTRGCRSFHIDSLRSHDKSVSHRKAFVLEMGC